MGGGGGGPAAVAADFRDSSATEAIFKVSGTERGAVLHFKSCTSENQLVIRRVDRSRLEIRHFLPDPFDADGCTM